MVGKPRSGARWSQTCTKLLLGTRICSPLLAVPLVLSVTVSVSVAATHSGYSGRVILDTRATQTGSIAGRVTSGGSSVAGALLQLRGTTFAATSGRFGTFSISDIPVGQGYVLDVGADGHQTASRSDLNVTIGNLHVGDVDLIAIARPYDLIPTIPDLNPISGSIEEGGTAYRYYRVVAADGRTPVGGVDIVVRVRGGPAIAQSSDQTDYWVGRTAGRSDADGLVRLRVPALAVGTVGNQRMIDVLESGVVRCSFTVQVVSRTYEEMWKHKVGGGVSGKVGIGVIGGRIGASGAYETTVRHEIKAGLTVDETIERRRIAKLQAGVESGGGIKIVAGGVARVGTGGYLQTELASAYQFDSATTHWDENALKLYVALGDPMSLMLGPAKGFYDFVSTSIEPCFLNDVLASVEGTVHAGGYAEGEASWGLKLGKNVSVGLNAELGVEAEASFGYVEEYRPAARHCYVFGMAARGEVSADIGARFGTKPTEGGILGASLFIGGEAQLLGRAWRNAGALFPQVIEIEQTGYCSTGWGLSIPGWDAFEGGSLVPDTRREYTETLRFNVGSRSNFDHLAGIENIWSTLLTGAQGSVVSMEEPAALVGSLIQNVCGEQGKLLEYEKSVYAAHEEEVEIGFDVDLGIGLKVDIEGSHERGVEVVNERGRIWQYRRAAVETYPAITDDMLPSQTIFDHELRWAGHATAPLVDAFNAFTETISGILDNAFEIGETLLVIPAGALPSGSTLQGGHVDQPSPASTTLGSRRLAVRGGSDPLPTSSNMIYGIGGTFFFACSNTLAAPASLQIGYTDEEMTGLDEAGLRLYRLGDEADRWTLVGGAVNVQSNFVSSVVTQFGTYAVAPPMPAGSLVLGLSTNLLRADGTSLVSVSVSDIRLNTGECATQSWVFTASATGVRILDHDVDTNSPGVQVCSSNAAITVTLQAPPDGLGASIALRSVEGDSVGHTGIPLVDSKPPGAPSSVVAVAGQSCVWVSWSTNAVANATAWLVHYRQGAAGPPYDGTAKVEGAASPVRVTGTNWVLRGLERDSSYYVAVSSVDAAGNTSPLTTAAGSVATAEGPPASPTAAAADFGEDGTNRLMWALSEDDGFNDRDVLRYDVLRAELPGGEYQKVGEARAGVGLYVEMAPAVAAAHFLGYAVQTIDTNGLASDQEQADHVLADGNVDNDVDGMSDAWEELYGFDPMYPADADDDTDGDGLSNLDEYRRGTHPRMNDTDGDGMNDGDEVVAGTDPTDGLRVFRLSGSGPGIGGKALVFTWDSVSGRWYTVYANTNLLGGTWSNLQKVVGDGLQKAYTNSPTGVRQQYYRLGVEVPGR
jgi:hypothetical protein